MDNGQLTHPDPERLSAFGLGLLDDPELTTIGQHLEACVTCRTQVEELADDALARLVRETAEVASPAVPAGLAEHPRYRILEQLGAGGMGAVYRAEHRLMQRTVALKLLNQGLTRRPGMVERFHRELLAAAQLTHPNIVHAYDAEKAGDTHFLVMEYVAGTTLARVVEERGPLPVRQACDYVRQAALGLQHAFEHGMVHRDVKPHNLMLTRTHGAPSVDLVKILDFGLARLATEIAPAGTDAAANPSTSASGAVTQAGMMLGTADYIAPEQVGDPHAADIRADVYGLGCTLYFLLTGHPPFPEGTVMDKLTAHRQETPQPLTAFRADLPPRLAMVLDRMIAKDPNQRYQTPAEVARALTSYAQPSRPVPRGVVAACLALVAGVVLLLVGAVYRITTDKGELIIRTDDPNIEVTIRQGGQLVSIMDLKSRQTLTLRSGEYELGLPDQATGLKLSTNTFTLKRGEQRVVNVERVPARPSLLGEATKREDQVTTTDVARVVRQEVLFFDDVSLSVSRPLRDYIGHTAAVTRVAFSPDGRRALSCSTDKTIRLWDVATGKEVRRLTGHQDRVDCVRFTRDGRRAVSGSWDYTVRLWDLETGKELKRLHTGWNIAGHITDLALFPGERRCLVCAVDHSKLLIWDLEADTVERAIAHHDYSVSAAALSPDGRRVVFGNGDTAGPVRVWDVDGDREERRFTGPGGPVAAVAFSPDRGGQRVLVGSHDRTVRLWEVGNGRELRRFPGHTAEVNCVAFSPDGRRILSGSADRTVRLWDVETGKELACFTGHTDSVRSVGFSPDGRAALSGGDDKLVRLWGLPQ
jgi:tRNA A-37 threonylcarbamoyl transferase component Bud32